MYCRLCGAQMRDSSRFCPKCGTAVRPVAPDTARPLTDAPDTNAHVQVPMREDGADSDSSNSGVVVADREGKHAGDKAAHISVSDSSASEQRTKGTPAIVAILLIALVAIFVIAGMGQSHGGANGSGTQSGILGVASSFSIEGKWKNVGEDTYGQIQGGSIVVFDGSHCNVVSPADTYALTKNGSDYRLDCTTALFSETLSFTVKVTDNNHIDLLQGSGTDIKLERVG